MVEGTSRVLPSAMSVDNNIAAECFLGVFGSKPVSGTRRTGCNRTKIEIRATLRTYRGSLHAATRLAFGDRPNYIALRPWCCRRVNYCIGLANGMNEPEADFTTPAAEQLSKSTSSEHGEVDILLHPHGSLPYFGQADTHRERRRRRRRVAWQQAVAAESSRFRVIRRRYADEVGDGQEGRI